METKLLNETQTSTVSSNKSELVEEPTAAGIFQLLHQEMLDDTGLEEINVDKTNSQNTLMTVITNWIKVLELMSIINDMENFILSLTQIPTNPNNNNWTATKIFHKHSNTADEWLKLITDEDLSHYSFEIAELAQLITIAQWWLRLVKSKPNPRDPQKNPPINWEFVIETGNEILNNAEIREALDQILEDLEEKSIDQSENTDEDSDLKVDEKSEKKSVIKPDKTLHKNSTHKKISEKIQSALQEIKSFVKDSKHELPSLNKAKPRYPKNSFYKNAQIIQAELVKLIVKRYTVIYNGLANSIYQHLQRVLRIVLLVTKPHTVEQLEYALQVFYHQTSKLLSFTHKFTTNPAHPKSIENAIVESRKSIRIRNSNKEQKSKSQDGFCLAMKLLEHELATFTVTINLYPDETKINLATSTQINHLSFNEEEKIDIRSISEDSNNSKALPIQQLIPTSSRKTSSVKPPHRTTQSLNLSQGNSDTKEDNHSFLKTNTTYTERLNKLNKSTRHIVRAFLKPLPRHYNMSKNNPNNKLPSSRKVLWQALKNHVDPWSVAVWGTVVASIYSNTGKWVYLAMQMLELVMGGGAQYTSEAREVYVKRFIEALYNSALNHSNIPEFWKHHNVFIITDKISQLLNYLTLPTLTLLLVLLTAQPERVDLEALEHTTVVITLLREISLLLADLIAVGQLRLLVNTRINFQPIDLSEQLQALEKLNPPTKRQIVSKNCMQLVTCCFKGCLRTINKNLRACWLFLLAGCTKCLLSRCLTSSGLQQSTMRGNIFYDPSALKITTNNEIIGTSLK